MSKTHSLPKLKLCVSFVLMSLEPRALPGTEQTPKGQKKIHGKVPHLQIILSPHPHPHPVLLD